MMVRAKAKPKEVLSTNELGALKQEREELESSLRDDGFGAGTKGEQVDRVAIQRQIGRISQAIVDGTPGKLTGKQQDSLHREARQLEERFQEGLNSKYEQDHPAKCPGAVKKHLKWLDRNEKTGYVDRYRQIQRTINPGEEKSIESLRKDR